MLRLLVALAVVLSLTSAVRSDDAKDIEAMQGTWLPATAELGGQKMPDEVRKSIRLVLKGDRYTVTVGTEGNDRGTVKVNSSAKPKTMDITGNDGPNKGKTFLCIYELTGDTLKVCYDLSGKARPADFSTKPGTQLYLVTYQREKP
jgi:uncharacterized protein (TIGR03067 family)